MSKRKQNKLLNGFTVSLLMIVFSTTFLVWHYFVSPTEVNIKHANERTKFLTLSQSIALGVVEGLTEYLPVSSTGHLLLAESIMGIRETPKDSSEKGTQVNVAIDAYTICIQLGAILAVLGLYLNRFKQMILGLFGKDVEGRHMLINICAGFTPAMIIGLLFNKTIKAYLFGVWPVTIAWFIGGIVILAVDRQNKKERKGDHYQKLSLCDMSWQKALTIGFIQCIAMWPGVSRSLVTIIGGLFVGLSLPAAVEFSFLLGLVTLSAATGYDIINHGQLMLQTFDASSLAVGVVCAFGAAALSVKWMVAYLNRNGMAIFGYYRIGLSLVVCSMLLIGIL
jgi:undecaprenyl-diphosphatase